MRLFCQLHFLMNKAELQTIKRGYQWRIQDFPLGGGVLTHWGGTNLQRIHFSVKTYAKMKEMDPVGGGHVPQAPPGSANGYHSKTTHNNKLRYRFVHPNSLQIPLDSNPGHRSQIFSLVLYTHSTVNSPMLETV